MPIELGLIFFGLAGVLIRRNLIAIGFCFQLVFLGITLWLTKLGATKVALSLGIVFALISLVYAVMTVFVWRYRGTLHLDEIQELRG